MGNSFVLNYLLPFIAIIVSIFSLGFSLLYNRKTIRLAEKHNIKSVEPLIDTNYIRSLTDDKKYIAQFFTIKNCGLGPAIINSFYFIVDGEKYEDMATLYETKLGSPPKYKEREYFLVKNTVMSPNDVIKIFEFHYSYTLEEDGMAYIPDDYAELTERISVKIEYETIYGGKRFLYNKSIGLIEE